MAGLSSHYMVDQRISIMAQEAASLSSKCSLSEVAPNTAQVAANHRSLSNFYQAAPSQAQVAADLGLHWSTSKEDLDPKNLVVIFRLQKNPTK